MYCDYEELHMYRDRLEAMLPETPIWEKDCITVEEAAAYTGIGRSTIRSEISKKNCPFVIQNGKQYMIVRKKFEKYIEERNCL
ncbi:excisionase [Frisingicoccus sp.]